MKFLLLDIHFELSLVLCALLMLIISLFDILLCWTLYFLTLAHLFMISSSNIGTQGVQQLFFVE